MPDVGAEIYARVDGPVARVFLDRPGKRNALSLAHWRELARLLVELREDDAVRILEVRSTGSVFCAGADRSEFTAERSNLAGAQRYGAVVEAAMREMRDFSRPTVSVVRGACVGGGVDLVLATDIVLADQTARFTVFPAGFGVTLPLPATQRLVAALGDRLARYLLLGGGVLDADAALSVGLVSDVCGPAELEARTRQLVDRLCNCPEVALRSTKQMLTLVQAGAAESGERAVRLEQAVLDTAATASKSLS